MAYENRFWSKVDVGGPDACWEWRAGRTPEGYGSFYVGGPKRLDGAHRVAYELLVGPIPNGLVIDHLCRNRGCVNPAHMEAVTAGENARRGVAHRKSPTHCPQGHEFTPENTKVTPSGWRYCGECNRARARRNHTRRKAVA